MAAGRKDYYKILGVGHSADEKMIKPAYRRLALTHHPDVEQGKRTADRFRDIHDAYTVLSNPEARARYDRTWAADRARAQRARSPEREDSVSRGTVRSYSFDVGGLGIRLGHSARLRLAGMSGLVHQQLHARRGSRS